MKAIASIQGLTKTANEASVGAGKHRAIMHGPLHATFGKDGLSLGPIGMSTWSSTVIRLAYARQHFTVWRTATLRLKGRGYDVEHIERDLEAARESLLTHIEELARSDVKHMLRAADLAPTDKGVE